MPIRRLLPMLTVIITLEIVTAGSAFAQGGSTRQIINLSVVPSSGPALEQL